jgi:hypothetical protein
MLIPHRKHITSLLQAQQVNAIYGFVTMLSQFWTLSIVSLRRAAFGPTEWAPPEDGDRIQSLKRPVF